MKSKELVSWTTLTLMIRTIMMLVHTQESVAILYIVGLLLLDACYLCSNRPPESTSSSSTPIRSLLKLHLWTQ